MRQRTAVSQAAHPPCNSADPCAMIRAEVRRGCEMLGHVTLPAAPDHHR